MLRRGGGYKLTLQTEETNPPQLAAICGGNRVANLTCRRKYSKGTFMLYGMIRCCVTTDSLLNLNEFILKGDLFFMIEHRFNY